MIEVELPDGSVAEFPDGTPPEAMKAAIQKRFPPNAAAPDPASPPPAAQAQVAAAPNSAAAQEAFAAASAVNPMNRAAPEAQQQPANFGDVLATFVGHGISDIPIIGKALQNAGDFVGTEIGGRLTGKDPAEWRAELAEKRKGLDERYPIASFTGGLAGGLGAMGLAGKTVAGAQALGLTGNIGARVGNSTLSGGAIAAGDASVRGGDAGDVMSAGGLGGLISGAIPLVGGAIGLGVRGVMNKAQPLVGAITDPAKEAARRTGMAVQRDMTANPQSIMNSTDEAVAAANNVPLVNADRGGETTRALARSVANQSPEARATLEKVASDRFDAQAGRAVDVMKRIAGGNVDDLAYQDTIRQMAKAKNKPAYDAAEAAPGAQAIWSPNIRQLMQSDTFRQAVKMTEKRGTDFAAVSGSKAVRNPFVFGADGSVSLAKQPGGATALPSLRFWDQVKRNLDGMVGVAKRNGDNTEVGLLMQMKQMLTQELDAAVPQYANARSGAAAFFDAEDALDAGKKFAGQPRAIPETERAFASMNQSEQQAFRTGFASEIIDRIKDTKFRTNVIASSFGSPAKREMMELVFGPAKARELEAYIRVEEGADMLRGAVSGNSTTARQLMELGIGAGGGLALSGGDWKGALGGAALARGARFAGQKLDSTVMQEVAKLLTSGNAADMKKAVTQATLSNKWMEALRRLEMGGAITSRAGAAAAVPALVGAER